MNKNLLFIFSIILVAVFSSCLSSKKLNYFDDQIPGVQNLDSSKDFTIQKLKANDRIAIVVSSTDPALTAYLNPNPSSLSSAGGYLIDPNGTIEFPLLGKVPVAGLTTVEAATLLKEKLTYYYKDLYINVTLLGKVTFLTGRSGGSVVLQNERMTIFEVIAQIPNSDPYDQRNDVWLVREDSGKRIFAKLDLNSKKIFDSKYYYLKNNDLVYIKPGRFSNTLFNSPSSPIRSIVTVIGTVLALILMLRNF